MSVVEVDRLFTERMYEEAAALAAKGLQKGGHSDDVAKLLSRRSEVRACHVRGQKCFVAGTPSTASCVNRSAPRTHPKCRRYFAWERLRKQGWRQRR